MGQDKRVTLLERLKKDGEVALYHILSKNKDWALGLPKDMGLMVLGAAESFNDELTERYTEYYRHAVEDSYLLPVESQPPDFKRIAEATEEAKRGVASAMADLYKEIPKTNKVKVPTLVSQDEHEMTTVEKPVLLKTRKRILGHVAVRWAETTVPEEARRLFAVLYEESAVHFSEVEKQAVEVVRGVSLQPRHGWKVIKAMQFTITPYDNKNYPLMNALMRHWLGARGRDQTIRDFTVLEPLLAASPGAHDAVAEYAKRIGELDQKSESLKEKLTGYTVERAYPNPESITVTASFNDRAWGGDRDGHRRRSFESAREKVQEWRRENEHIPVLLRIHGMNDTFRGEVTWKDEILLDN